MFFVLSKTLGIMMLPVNFLMGIGLLGVIRQRAVAACKLSSHRWCCSRSPDFRRSETCCCLLGAPPWDRARRMDGIIVLGGSVDPDVSLARGRP